VSEQVKPILRVRHIKGRLWLEGDTYPLRDKLKAMGFRWDPGYRMWYLDISSIDEILKKLGEYAEVKRGMLVYRMTCPICNKTFPYQDYEILQRYMFLHLRDGHGLSEAEARSKATSIKPEVWEVRHMWEAETGYPVV
jgi:hypothetical protein